MRGFEGRTIAITGAARGLGRGYALGLARLGAHVVVNDVDGDGVERVRAEVEREGGRATAHHGSVASWDGAASLVDTAVGADGVLDGLVANAGVFHARAGASEDEQALREIVEVNLLGTLFCGTLALRRMLAQGHGSIVTSTSGAQLGVPTLAAYGATKGGIATATAAWAAEAAGSGVRVNAISPVARTRLTEGWDTPETAEPEDVVPLVAFLLGDRSATVTGQVLRLDAQGLSILRPAAYPTPPVPIAGDTAEAVADAFDRELGAELQPVGLAGAELASWRR